MSQTAEPQTESRATNVDLSESMSHDGGHIAAGKVSSLKELISIPRWAVYFQAALLGLIATTFFIFGMMVGSLTPGTNAEINAAFDSRVQGSVAYREDGDLRADEGAVVFFLPTDKKPDERSPGDCVNPGNFKALDNAGIDRIHDLGGAVVRADEYGQFDVIIDAKYGDGQSYYLLIVSNSKRGEDTEPMQKEQVASIGTFFIPVEDVVEDRSYYWRRITVDSEKLHLPEIEF
ncbi:MAG: hypothetical protein AB8B55_12975 [Mariniblastus sp.]